MKLLTVLNLLLTFAVSALAQLTCTDSTANPVASLYPNTITGTINGTITIIPIPLTLARSIIPSKYNILTRAYQTLLPDFPKDSYPLLVRTGCDHGIVYEAFNVQVPDFIGVHLQFPFVDLLSDGYSSFLYQQILSVSNNSNAINGVLDYGGQTITSVFNPIGQAYKSNSQDDVFFSAVTAEDHNPLLSECFVKNHLSLGPYPLSFYKNVTNQPGFYNGTTCDNQINLFNTTLSTGANAPVGIVGEITISEPLLPGKQTFSNVHGILVDVAFVENNYMSCEGLKGYQGTGEDD